MMTSILLQLMNFLTWFKSIKKLLRNNKKIKNINALNDLNTSLATNYEDLLCKFKLLSKEHKELKLNLLCKEKEAQGRIARSFWNNRVSVKLYLR